MSVHLGALAPGGGRRIVLEGSMKKYKLATIRGGFHSLLFVGGVIVRSPFDSLFYISYIFVLPFEWERGGGSMPHGHPSIRSYLCPPPRKKRRLSFSMLKRVFCISHLLFIIVSRVCFVQALLTDKYFVQCLL